MNWLPVGADFLTVFGTALAVLTAALGIAVAVSQLTGATRARRAIDWTTTAQTTESDEARRQVLEQMKLDGQGYLVASSQVPWWRFSEAAVWMLAAPAIVILSAWRRDETSVTVVLITTSVTTLMLVARRAIRLYAERLRVAREFALGGSAVRPARTDLLNQMEGGTRREFLLGLFCSVSVMALGALVALALMEGGRNSKWAWVPVALVACGSGFSLVHSYANAWALKSAQERPKPDAPKAPPDPAAPGE